MLRFMLHQQLQVGVGDLRSGHELIVLLFHCAQAEGTVVFSHG